MQRYKLLTQIFGILSIIVFLLCLYIIFFLPNYNKLEQKPHTEMTFDNSFKVTYDLSMDEAIQIVDDFMQIHYTLDIVEKNDEFLGRNLCCTTYIQLTEQSGWDVLWVLTHELVHYKYQTSNETFTDFKTWQLLYESGMPILEDRAKYEAYCQCELGYYKDTKYDVSWYIVKYLKENEL